MVCDQDGRRMPSWGSALPGNVKFQMQNRSRAFYGFGLVGWRGRIDADEVDEVDLIDGIDAASVPQLSMT
jgi:hypothetical protein